jgi:hypothetical protein
VVVIYEHFEHIPFFDGNVHYAYVRARERRARAFFITETQALGNTRFFEN